MVNDFLLTAENDQNPQLHYRLFGQGQVVVLLHGLFGSLDNLGMLTRDLQRDHCVLAIDLRNHGHSFHHSQMDYPSLVADVVALLQQLSLSSVTLIGHSMGGKVAMAMSLLAPQKVRQLVVLDIAPVAYLPYRHQKIFKGLAAVEAAGARHRAAAGEILRSASLDKNVVQFLLKSFDNGQWRFNWPVLQRCYAEISDWQIKGQWQGNACFISGSLSDYLSEAYEPAVKQHFPQALSYRLPAAGHWLAAEQPAAVLAIIRRFMSGVPNII